MLDALSVLLQGDEVGDDFFLAIIAAHDELEFDAHGRAPLGLSGGCMMQAILPEFIAYPQLGRVYDRCGSFTQHKNSLQCPHFTAASITASATFGYLE
jgi:hypothetical protein